MCLGIANYQASDLKDAKDSAKDTAIKEADAELRANRKPLLDRFYPEVVAYHKVREEREADLLGTPAPTLAL